MAAMDSDAQARAVERDIERTRNEMDATLSELERRLAPSEIVHQGAETVRETVRDRARSLAESAVDTLKRHPVPVAVAIGLALARYAYRPSAEERLRMQADEDFDRAWRAVRNGLARAKDQTVAREAELEQWASALLSEARTKIDPAVRTAGQLAQRGGEDVWRLLQQAATTSRDAGRALREGSSTHPLATIALLAIAAALGARRYRSA
jgi:hypothetical protein